jgi:hypothetical protein
MGATGLLPSLFLLGSSGFECLALGRDALQQFIPGLNERSRSLDLKSVAQILNMNAGLVELGPAASDSGSIHRRRAIDCR